MNVSYDNRVLRFEIEFLPPHVFDLMKAWYNFDLGFIL